jgi:vacuolar-type H+-ATPase subunit I/STV1
MIDFDDKELEIILKCLNEGKVKFSGITQEEQNTRAEIELIISKIQSKVQLKVKQTSFDKEIAEQLSVTKKKKKLF